MHPRPYPIAELPDDTIAGRGLRVLAYVLETGATFELTDDDLRMADHVYPIAVSGREILPIAVDRLTAARTLILGALRNRAAIDRDRLAALQAGAEQGSEYPKGSDRPGAGVPLQPAPRPLAPAGSALPLRQPAPDFDVAF